MGQAISKLTIKGYKSIRNLENFELRNLNILIGPNGAGKSNFVSFFELLQVLLLENSEEYLPTFGTADRVFYMGSKVTKVCEIKVYFANGFDGFLSCSLVADPDDKLIRINPQKPGGFGGDIPKSVGESFCEYLDNAQEKIQSGIRLYHFNDTSISAAIRKSYTKRDYDYLRPDASNLAAFLLFLRKKYEKNYQSIREVVQLAAPFFDDFLLRDSLDDPEEKTLLDWCQKGSDYPFRPSQMSDGTLRFICLATALLQPNPPSTILLDEPELGLHPCALAILAGLIQKATACTQVIVSTQSAALIDHFQPGDIILVERKNSESVFSRPNTEKLKIWLEDYSLGEIWSRNIIEGLSANE